MADQKVTLTFTMSDSTTQDVEFVVPQGPAGAKGDTGATGSAGPEGDSAYDSYVATTTDDPVLTEEEWVASLKGETGATGATGPKGDTGDTGAAGADGADGVGIVSVSVTQADVDDAPV